MGTLGFAINSEYNGFIFDFECARNLGRQKVKGWDSNTISIENRNGSVTLVNSEVLAVADQGSDIAGEKAIISKTNQSIINKSPRGRAVQWSANW